MTAWVLIQALLAQDKTDCTRTFKSPPPSGGGLFCIYARLNMQYGVIAQTFPAFCKTPSKSRNPADKQDSNLTFLSHIPLMIDPANLVACPACGLVQQRPAQAAPHGVVCARCTHRFRLELDLRAPQRTAALALAALIVYIPAILLPVMTISQFGHTHRTGILPGVISLIGDGRVFIGLIIVVCSVLIPLGKITGLLILSLEMRWLRLTYRNWTWRLIELTGKWSMMDVLLVAVVIAVMKLGDLAHVEPGPGLLLFAAFVTLSLMASACFDPRALWLQSRNQHE